MVLLPYTTLPLRIFEARYRALVADCIAYTRPLVLATVLPEHAKDAFGEPPFHPIACAGRIMRHTKSPDGRYKIVVEGMEAVRLSELRERSTLYREARAERLPVTYHADGQIAERAKLLRTCLHQLASLPSGLVRSVATRLLKVHDVQRLSYQLGAGLLGNTESRQQLLATTDLLHRLDRGISVITEVLLSASAAGSSH